MVQKNLELVELVFKDEILEKHIKNLLLTSFMAIVAIPLFGVLDCFVYPEKLSLLFTIRVIMTIPFIIVIFTIRKSKFLKKFILSLIVVLFLNSGFGIALMIHLTEGYKSPYYAGLVVVILFLSITLTLKIKRTIVICLLIYGSYIIPILIKGNISEIPIFINNNAFLIIMLILSVLGAYSREQFRFNELKSRFEVQKANENLKKLDNLKTQLVANISHEIRGPLSNIMSPMVHILSNIEQRAKVVSFSKSIFETMVSNTKKLYRLIDDFLDFNKLEKNMMQLQCRKIDIKGYLKELIADVLPNARIKQLKIKSNFPVHPVELYLDPWKVDKIFPNLLGNAVKFTPMGGTITVGITEKEETVYITVEDTGEGIMKEELNKIFDRFYQADATYTRKQSGTGIGLNLAKSFVNLHHGDITVKSEIGKGAIFTVVFHKGTEHLLPGELQEERKDVVFGEERRSKKEDKRKKSDRRKNDRRYENAKKLQFADIEDNIIKQKLLKEIARKEQAHEEKKEATIMIVDDDAGILQNLREILKDKYNIQIAFDGEEGWDKIMNNPPDLVISDVMMPKMDGNQLTENIKTNPKTQHIPVILFTAKGEFPFKLRGLKEGAIDYLSKPVDHEELKVRIMNQIKLKESQQTLARAEEAERSKDEVIVSFAESLTLRDPNTAEHCKDILELGCLIAEKLKIPINQTLKYSLLLHDIGKIGIPDAILLKEDKLSNEEFAIIKTHPQVGSDLVKHCKGFDEVSGNILSHQERFDGTGYPRGLKGEEIQIIARIIAVADTYHVITHERPYKRALEPKEAIKELLRNKGTQFDPKIVEIFIEALIERYIISRNDINEVKKMLQ